MVKEIASLFRIDLDNVIKMVPTERQTFIY